MCECKWRNELLDLSVLQELRRKTELFRGKRNHTWYYLFSKSGFTKAVLEEAKRDKTIVLVDLEKLFE
jgi:hypothetical protein